MSRHVEHRPTKEVFFPVTSAWDEEGTHDLMTGLGGFAVALINGDDELAYVTAYVPHDFDELEELVLAIIGPLNIAPVSPMRIRVVTDYGKAGQAYFEHNELEAVLQNVVGGRIYEIDIKSLVDIRPLEARDYLGVQAARVAGYNTNAYILGVRLKYKYK